jgi:hypothetical protein
MSLRWKVMTPNCFLVFQPEKFSVLCTFQKFLQKTHPLLGLFSL